ncbi:glycosyltransferase involved in cell wall biosynthesis [Winogradskyella pacifica]|uniref:Glycosyltransferase involved in cell wall biosynthesis n=1 Tax=Winogradskyella pacifica TaxID=664642 RepID=A0A3D9N3D1_9FLAO|nr:glycosyltransferase family 4 protein [Winogradskyella pacifica]REE24463.1 glycosyltransferase involved in cell wall biosynthesis [Winogradskyella pacifica]
MSRPLRILFTIPNFKTAGSQYVLLALIARLNKHNFNVIVGIENHWDEAKKVIPVSDLVELPKLFKVSKIRFLKQYIKVLKKNQIDLVHSWDYKSNYLEPLACRLSGVKYLYTKKNNSWSRSWQLKSLFSHFIAYDQPEMKKRFFSNKHYANKIKLIPHGVDLLKFFPLEKISHSTFNMCYVGTINENKNQLFILKAMLNLPETIHLNVFGKADVNYKKELDVFIENNDIKDRVHFYGYISQSQLPEIFRIQDVLVLSSLEEGFPVCLLEAMACGLPVLSSDSGGGAKFMLNTMVDDCLFSIYETDDFNHKILNLTHNPNLYKSLRSKGLDLVHKKFSIEREVNSYVELYTNL